MASRVFCIGNGESRKSFDLIKLKSYGKIYGCNALYRDFTPDVLIAVDHGIMHEIYQSGYCQNNETWLRNWVPVPGMMYEQMKYGGVQGEDLEKLKKENFAINENKKDDRQMFVIHGSNLAGKVNILKKNKELTQKEVNHTNLNITWVTDNDKAHTLEDLVPGERDRGYAAGATSGRVALIQNKDVKEVYLIGHDLESNTHQINNMYKGTKYYGLPENKPIPSVNWRTQWKTLFCEYPHVQFYKVNPEGNNGKDNISKPVDDWVDVRNLKYIDFQTTLDKIGIK